MSENNYGALMLKSALDTSVDVTKIIAPGIYPVTQGNASAPDSSAGLMMVVLTAKSQKTTFQKESSSVVYSLINGKWKKPEPGDVGNFGTAAFCDTQTSQDDVTDGRVLVNGGAVAVRRVFAIKEGAIDDANNLPTNAVSFVYGDAKNSPNGNSGTILDVSGLGGGYNLQLFVNYQTGNILAFRSFNGDNRTWNKWNYIYSTGYKPTAVDVGALPITGGTLNGNLKVDSFSAKNINIYDVVPTGGYLINHYTPSGANRCAYGYYNGNFDVHFYNDAGTWVSNPVSIHPNGDCFFGSVYDQGHRVYSPVNPQPIDLSAYATQSWVLQNFVQSIDLTAPAEVGFWDGNGYTRATDGAAMYNFKMVGGSSNVGNYIIRYTRKLVNGTWYVIN